MALLHFKKGLFGSKYISGAKFLINSNSTLSKEYDKFVSEEADVTREKKQLKRFLVSPHYDRQKLQNEVQHITSFKVNINKISAVSMTRDLEITSFKELDIGKRRFVDASKIPQQIKEINNFIKSLPEDANYCVIEKRQLYTVNQSVAMILQEMKYLQALITAYYCRDDCEHAYTVDRQLACDILNLRIKSSSLIASSEKLVCKICTKGFWHGMKITIPEHVKVVEDAVLIMDRNEDWKKISEPLNEAFLQGLLFFDHINGRRTSDEIQFLK